ncbi:pyridoxal phosphate-dependent aminotransferase [Bacilliculturomica massiliensis]|uniref:pyridoxal phosphate-dependent aminotransferase n=1 Tax=Bacilliculturomica massiliensis TaxID=1917867 RepID=UPI00102F7FFC|nr:pyridoxal phosphate-dependent aminotransferase [Bacilliculturomica massiliensis]
MERQKRGPAHRLDNVKFSPVRRVLNLANELQSQGRDIVHFEIGEPDFDTPDLIVSNSVTALRDERKTHYASNLGDIGLRNKIAELLKKRNGVEADPAKNIIVTVGAAEAVFAGIMAVVNEGDEVIILTPAFMFYENTIKMAGAEVVEVPLKPENGYQIQISELKEKITDRTRMIVLNNPHNPSGVVFRPEDLMEIGKLAVENDIMILSDEIYDQIVYDGRSCLSLASVPEFREHVITINGFSKAYAMTGWRLGYIVADEKWIQAILKVHQYTTTCVPTFIQIGTARSMLEESCLQQVENMRATFEKRRNLLYEKLDAIEGIRYVPSQGAFYTLIDISKFGLSDGEFAERLIREKGVAVVPASGFSENFKGHIRISYATSESQISDGLEKLKEFCDELRGEK